MTATDLKKRAIALAEKTKIDSVTPEEVGQLSNDIVEYIENVEINGSSLGIRKTYTSVSAMESDSTAPKDDKGVLLRRGMLVNIYNQEDPDSADNGKVFSFQNPGWAFRGTVDAGYATKEELTELQNELFIEKGWITVSDSVGEFIENDRYHSFIQLKYGDKVKRNNNCVGGTGVPILYLVDKKTGSDISIETVGMEEIEVTDNNILYIYIGSNREEKRQPTELLINGTNFYEKTRDIAVSTRHKTNILQNELSVLNENVDNIQLTTDKLENSLNGESTKNTNTYPFNYEKGKIYKILESSVGGTATEEIYETSPATDFCVTKLSCKYGDIISLKGKITNAYSPFAILDSSNKVLYAAGRQTSTKEYSYRYEVTESNAAYVIQNTLCKMLGQEFTDISITVESKQSGGLIQVVESLSKQVGPNKTFKRDTDSIETVEFSFVQSSDSGKIIETNEIDPVYGGKYYRIEIPENTTEEFVNHFIKVKFNKSITSKQATYILKCGGIDFIKNLSIHPYQLVANRGTVDISSNLIGDTEFTTRDNNMYPNNVDEITLQIKQLMGDGGSVLLISNKVGINDLITPILALQIDVTSLSPTGGSTITVDDKQMTFWEYIEYLNIPVNIAYPVSGSTTSFDFDDEHVKNIIKAGHLFVGIYPESKSEDYEEFLSKIDTGLKNSNVNSLFVGASKAVYNNTIHKVCESRGIKIVRYMLQSASNKATFQYFRQKRKCIPINSIYVGPNTDDIGEIFEPTIIFMHTDMGTQQNEILQKLKDIIYKTNCLSLDSFYNIIHDL